MTMPACCAVMPNTKLQEHSGSEKAWVWSAVDFADEVQKPELFCIRFASAESMSFLPHLKLLLKPVKMKFRNRAFLHQIASAESKSLPQLKLLLKPPVKACEISASQRYSGTALYQPAKKAQVIKEIM